MSKYTIEDVSNIIPVEQSATTTAAIEAYLNEGVIPPYDPCTSCEPNHIRKLISLIQTAERTGLFPPKRVIATGSTDEPEVDFSEIFTEEPEDLGEEHEED